MTETSPAFVAQATSGQARSSRVAYFDILRSLALVRVISYHALGLAWLHVALPAMGVMFGLAGSLMARSLTQRDSLSVIITRVRRLLPPLWLYGAVLLLIGLETLDRGPRAVTHVFYWVLPLRDPHQAGAAGGTLDTLWYVRAYLWFVLLSPLVLWAVRRMRVLLLVLPAVALTALLFVNDESGRTGNGWLRDILVYGPCWLLGFADNDGLLRLLPAWLYRTTAAVIGGVGIGLQVVFGADRATPAGVAGYALWSVAVVMVLLRWRPDTARLMRRRWVSRLVSFMNARAMTIYLWHDVGIVAVVAVCAGAGLHLWPVAQLPAVLAFVFVCCLLVGWIEDLAARRRPALLPGCPSDKQREPRVGHRQDFTYTGSHRRRPLKVDT